MIARGPGKVLFRMFNDHSGLLAGLSPNDVGVRAAFDWLATKLDLRREPRPWAQGHFYYLHTMARALHVAQRNLVSGRAHNWREELIDAIVKRQHEDGSWKNDADRWLEGEPVIASV